MSTFGFLNLNPSAIPTCADGSIPDFCGNCASSPNYQVGTCAGTVGGSSVSPAPGSGPNPSGPSSPINTSAGWLSGLGQVFTSIGNSVTSGLRAANAPGAVYPFATATGTNSSVSPVTLLSSPIILVGIAVIAYLLLRKRG